MFLLISLIICLSNFSSIAWANAKIKKSTVNTNSNTEKQTRNKGKVSDPQSDIKKILKDDNPTIVENLGENVKDAKFRAAIRSLAAVNKVKFEILSVPVVDSILTKTKSTSKSRLNLL